MGYVLMVVALIVAVFCYRRLRFYRGAVQDFTAALEGGRSFLLSELPPGGDATRLSRLQRTFNAFLENVFVLEQRAAGGVGQVETTLGQLQEAVLMVDHGGKLLTVNAAASRLFGIPREEEARRHVQRYIPSGAFLDYMHHLHLGGRDAQREIVFEVLGRQRWFEVAGICVPRHFVEGRGEHDLRVYLFVFHEITKLKELERVRRDFVANVSHELRTPVTVIKGFTDTLVQHHAQLETTEREQFLLKVHRNVERLHLLLEDLLTLSRLESSREELHGREVEVASLLEDSAELIRGRLPLPEALVIEMDPEASMVWVDELKFSRVMDNLFDNVVRYARGFTRVVLRTSREGEALWFWVEDDGPGVPEKDLPHLFERFYRVDKGRSRESGGTGLGLSIVKHIVLMHGGQVRVEHVPTGGVRVGFSLPLKRQNREKGVRFGE